MIVTYYPHSKTTHNFKDTELIFLEIQIIFQKFKVSRVFYHM
jgi:hypothetical protein